MPCLFASTAPSQETSRTDDSLHRLLNRTVRVTTALPPQWQEGRLVTMSSDSVQIATSYAVLMFASSSIEALEIRTSNRGSRARSGWLIGAGVGILGAVAYGLARCPRQDIDCSGGGYLLTGAVFAAPTSVVGALIGQATGREWWEPLERRRWMAGTTHARLRLSVPVRY